MKKYKKILPIIMLLMLFITSVSHAESMIRMEILPGYEGLILSGSVVPVEIEIESIGGDVQGKVKVSYKNDNQEVYVGSEIDIHLIDGSPKKYIVPLVIEQDVYTFQEDKFLLAEVFNQSGKLMSEQQVGITEIVDNDEIIAGIVSEEYVGLTYFNLAKVQLNDGETKSIKTIKLKASNFEESRYLEGLDLLIMDSVDMTISEKGLSNIDKWVEDGGVLLFSTGEQYGTQQQLQNKFGLKTSEEIIMKPLGGIDSVKQILFEDPTYKKSNNNEGIYSKVYGEGQLVIATFSLSGKQIVESTTNIQMISSLIQEHVIENGYIKKIDQDDYRGLSNLLNRVPREQMPSVRVIMMIVSIYIVIIGPIGYMALKYKKLTTYYWRLVAGMSIIATIVVFIAGRGIDFNRTIANGLTIIDQRNETTQTTSFLGVKYSGIGDVDIAPEKGQIKWSGSYAYGESPKKKTYYLEDDQQHIIFEDVKKFQFVNLMIENKLEISNEEQRMVLSDDKTEVVVTNPYNYPLTDVVVLTNGMSEYIERIEPKEEVRIELEATIYNQNSGRLNTYAFYDQINPDAEGLYEKNSIIESFFNNNQNGRTDANSDLMVFGFIENETTQKISINGDDVNVTGYSFWIDRIELGKPMAGEVVLPYGAINSTVNLHGETYYENYDQSYYGYGEAQFDFQLPSWLEAEEVTVSFYERKGIVYKVYNEGTQTWDELFFTDGNYEILLNQEQVSTEKNIRLMVINNGGDMFYEPLIEVKGVVKND